MRILISNKYYYPRGGADIYSIELEKLLKEKGHEVAFFSMQQPLNLKSEFSKYFPTEIDFDHKKPLGLIRFIVRPFGSISVRKRFTRLLKNFKPDILHLNNIHTQLSPILAVIASKHNIPVIWTLHDHKVLCPRYDCMRDGKPCELCFKNKFNALRYKCMKNSRVASFIAYLEALVWNKKTLSRYTSRFICPSTFLANNMIKGGFNSNQLIILPNFINDKKLISQPSAKENHYCYVGRLSTEKGIETLLRAANELPQYELKVIGTGPLESELKAKYEKAHIKFLGFKSWEDFKQILETSQCMVIPSECYENNPLSIIESLCLGTPVIGTNMGGIPELINPGVNGFTFESGNVSDLRNQIDHLFQISGNFDYIEIAKRARAKFNSENYYIELIKIYNGVLN